MTPLPNLRRIYTDGRQFPMDESPSWMGYSIGRWIDEDGDGRYDALEVETRISRTRGRSIRAGCRYTGMPRRL